ncbi:hypothetical protein GIB67_003435 [Kingdonia uniflora]|uniref:tRNA-intron lyase n=1 Tax=Kingdonia uniflora TaxID=39325 RepID=A0A7J7P946_9MAGN|nr:hypothetical protein GIB67_003435 [Kingdonia uniflora]
MGPRWKDNGSKATALADPMSNIVARLQSSLIQSGTCGFLSGCGVLLEISHDQVGLLNHACFGRPVTTADTDTNWFRLSLEEAFYMHHCLKCVEIIGEDKSPKRDDELWECMKLKKRTFLEFYKAYSHLRGKNWVVRSGSQYGVDFVAYRHHPALVHSEYAVIVSSEAEGHENCRLKLWSDFECTVRLSGSVAKTLLVLHIKSNENCTFSPSCLEGYTVEERTITRWSPEQRREDQPIVKAESSKG